MRKMPLTSREQQVRNVRRLLAETPIGPAAWRHVVAELDLDCRYVLDIYRDLFSAKEIEMLEKFSTPPQTRRFDLPRLTHPHRPNRPQGQENEK